MDGTPGGGLTDADDRVRRLVEQARRRREREAEDRAAFAAARTAGLRRRHAQKLTRNQETRMTDHADPTEYTPDELRHARELGDQARIPSQISPAQLVRFARLMADNNGPEPAEGDAGRPPGAAAPTARPDQLGNPPDDDTDPPAAA
ncbi:hypothetical protein [Yinghuangia soli]|uniref:Uncharacterized protein n=1 Tax=Yinghuangia soli TaxID=2908204 RepID=A0AA41PVR5_9ACTN|nr:hypothetical protein [Yinghuangia soli]MCF2526750.1 hypothetical protein [Yinghuangia soli]